jgi:hypothetical protein
MKNDSIRLVISIQKFVGLIFVTNLETKPLTSNSEQNLWMLPMLNLLDISSKFHIIDMFVIVGLQTVPYIMIMEKVKENSCMVGLLLFYSLHQKVTKQKLHFV